MGGFVVALKNGVDIVDAMAGSQVLGLLASGAEAAGVETPRYCLRLVPHSTLGLGVIFNSSFVKRWAVSSQLERSLRLLRVESIEMLTLHSESTGFPAFV